MSDKIYKKVELVGCSAENIEGAVGLALTKASETLRGLSWFEVKEIRGVIRDAKPCEWQVTVVAGLKVE